MDTNHKIQDGRQRNQIARIDKVSNLYLSVVEPLVTDTKTDTVLSIAGSFQCPEKILLYFL